MNVAVNDTQLLNRGHNTGMENDALSRLPLGIFDSGVGGLTVLKAIQEVLPNEDLVYLGDTARLPYGTKSPTSILRYATQATEKLKDQRIKLLVVACNTASAVALPALQAALSPLPVLGVVAPGAAAAVEVKKGGAHRLLATEATVRLGAYKKAIHALDPQATVSEQACELLVSLAEEGWLDGEIVTAIIKRYLKDLDEGPAPDTVILGCTHFPLLREALLGVVGPNIEVVDSAATTAIAVREELTRNGLLSDSSDVGKLRLLATDGCTRFARVGAVFLGRPLTAEDVELVDL